MRVPEPAVRGHLGHGDHLGECQEPTCKPDKATCKTGTECCSEHCEGGHCKPEPPATCPLGDCRGGRPCAEGCTCRNGTCQSEPDPGGEKGDPCGTGAPCGRGLSCCGVGSGSGARCRRFTDANCPVICRGSGATRVCRRGRAQGGFPNGPRCECCAFGSCQPAPFE